MEAEDDLITVKDFPDFSFKCKKLNAIPVMYVKENVHTISKKAFKEFADKNEMNKKLRPKTIDDKVIDNIVMPFLSRC